MSQRVHMENYMNVLSKQPINSPYLSYQPYPTVPLTDANPSAEASMATQPPPIDRVSPTLQQSSQQFYHFLRLMQIFPETHPATIHTILNLTNHNFFEAVDKLLYARRCKSYYNRNQAKRVHPYDYRSAAVRSKESPSPQLPAKIPAKLVKLQDTQSDPKVSPKPQPLGSTTLKIIVTNEKGDNVKTDNGDIITIDMPLDENFDKSPSNK